MQNFINNDNGEIDPHKLNVYLSYNRLTLKSFGKFCSIWGSIADEYSVQYQEIAGFQSDPSPTLEISTIHTGDSVKFTLGEGWLPKISSDENNDIIINTPKKIGIPILIGYLMLTACGKILDIQNKYLDNKIKQIEYELKKDELRYKTLEKSYEKGELEYRSKEGMNTFIQNNDYNIIKIYDIEVLNRIEHNSGLNTDR
jgi:hypothetical protein